MKNSIAKKQFNRKKMYIISAMLITMMLLPFSALATGGATSSLTSLATFFSDITKIFGVLLAIYSFMTLGPGISQHDSSQVKMGFLQLAGALLLIFHMQILNVMGITI